MTARTFTRQKPASVAAVRAASSRSKSTEVAGDFDRRPCGRVANICPSGVAGVIAAHGADSAKASDAEISHLGR